MKWFIFGKREAAIIIVTATVFFLTLQFAAYGVKSAAVSVDQKKIPIYSVDTQDKKIAVTFDAAWSNSDTDLLLSILDKHNAKATFFFTGEWVSKYPDDVRKIYAAGHSCQNHSDSHRHIKGMSSDELMSDILACNDKIKAITSVSPTFYRGPYGEYNNTLLNCTDELKMYALQWDVDSRDWQKKKSPQEICEHIVKYAECGSIILFHNDLKGTAEALDLTLSALSKKGYSCVTAEELVYKENYYIDSSGVQHKKN